MLCVQDMAMCEEAEQMTVQEVEGEGPPSPTSADDPKGIQEIFAHITSELKKLFHCYRNSVSVSWLELGLTDY